MMYHKEKTVLDLCWCSLLIHYVVEEDSCSEFGEVWRCWLACCTVGACSGEETNRRFLPLVPQPCVILPNLGVHVCVCVSMCVCARMCV